jgi:hypothetical protein
MDEAMKPDAIPLRAVLLLAGVFIAFTGVNIAFGGIATLGLQGSRDFVAITDEAAFLAQDSHVRFLGGLWLAVGGVFLAAAVRPQALKPAVLTCCVLIFAGGLARFSDLRFDLVFGPQIAGSLVAELVGMPLLFAWLRRTAWPSAA